jgi:hypothetical protein
VGRIWNSQVKETVSGRAGWKNHSFIFHLSSFLIDICFNYQLFFSSCHFHGNRSELPPPFSYFSTFRRIVLHQPSKVTPGKWKTIFFFPFCLMLSRSKLLNEQKRWKCVEFSTRRNVTMYSNGSIHKRLRQKSAGEGRGRKKKASYDSF